MFARIVDGIVQEIIELDSVGGLLFVGQVVPCDEAARVGMTWDGEEFSVLGPTADEIRAERDRLLAECDWTQLADAPLIADEKSAWAVYRQALRDVPQQAGFPASVTWPVAPVSN